MFSKFSEDARKVLINSRKEMIELKHAYIGTEHIILAILKNPKNNISQKLEKYNLTYEKFKDKLTKILGYGTEKNNYFLYTPLVKKVIEEAIIESRDNNNEEVTTEHLFLSILEEGEGIAIRIMIEMNIDLDELYSCFKHNLKIRQNKKNKKLLIEEIGYDINKQVISEKIDPVIGRDEEIDRIIEILCRRTKNNPLLLGEAGVGKSAIVEELSRRIVEKNVPDKLLNKRIISVAMSNLVSGTKYRGEFEEKITKILKEVEKEKNIIIFIDEIHTLVGAGGAEGAIDASNILKPSLARGKIKIIGATTNTEYKQYMEHDRALARRFQPIYIEEPKTDKTYEILKGIKPIYEQFHNVKIDDEILKLIVDLSNKYIYDRKQPDKSIDILDEAAARLSIKSNNKKKKISDLNKELKNITKQKNIYIMKNNFKKAKLLREQEKYIEDEINILEYNILNHQYQRKITKKLVGQIMEQKTKIPIYEINNDTKETINKLEKYLKKEVIGQEEAINKLCTITKKERLGFKKETKPTSLLFVGPTGVGKTLLVKKYNDQLYNNDNLIRLDMSEYKEEQSISKIIGSPPGYTGYNNKTTVLDDIKNKPHAIILLDEIEKAHTSVINLFLQVLDEGYLKASTGERINMSNNLIIMTSNVGANNKVVGFNNNKQKYILQELKDNLSPEFINRINDIIIFNKLTKENVQEILANKIKKLKKYYHKKNNVKIKIDDQTYKEILNNSNYEIFGARRLDNLIDNKLDNFIIEKIINRGHDINIKV